MVEETASDVVIAGAGTTGAYLAWKLSELGYSCTVLEAKPLETLGKDIGPFHVEEAAFELFGLPLPEGEELYHVERRQAMWSPGQGSHFRFEFPVYVMEKPLFTRRLHRYATGAGAVIIDNAQVTGLIIERGFPAGLKARRPDGGEVEARGRLVIDASGIDGAVRTLTPPGGWFENDPVTDRDTIFVYMETWGDLEGDVPEGVNGHPYFQGWCAPGPGDTRIVGVGMTGGFEAARRRHRVFTARLPFEGKVVSKASGRIPYRRPPYSLVDNGLMVAGDAAFMNKPFSGEGVTSAFGACLDAIEVAAAALEADDLSREALWPYNTRYFRGQGAKFAFMTAVLPALMGMPEEGMDLFFEVPGLLSESGARAMNEKYEIESDPAAVARALPYLFRGMLDGTLRASRLASLARAGATAARLKKLYSDYPEHPLGFGAWLSKVEPLWRYAAGVKYSYFEKVACGLPREGG